MSPSARQKLDRGQTSRTTPVPVVLLFALFAANLFYCWHVIDPHPSVDGPSYLEMAAQLRMHGDFAGFHLRAPGYPLFLALFMNARGEIPLRALTFIQTAMLLASALVFWHGLARLSRVPEVVAALVAALAFSQFQLVALAQLIATESLALFLMTALVVLYFRGVQQRSGVAWFAFVGLVCGFVALVRPQFYFVVGVLALGLAVKRLWRGLLALCAVALVLQGGWLARNYLVYDLPYPTSSVVYGYKEHLAKNDLYRFVDFGRDVDPTLVAALQALAPNEDEKKKTCRA
jgi:4-amino-4-deoxy-L-arabinose transferase-like glycosyltransferase